MWQTPSVDVAASLAFVNDKRGGSNLAARYEIFASGEALRHSFDARLSSDENGLPESLRLRAYRSDPTGQLLGPMHATHYALGDVGLLATGLVSQSSVGRGAVVTNRPIERPESFDRTDFRGDLPAGWDAELYRNGQLLAFATPNAAGRYEFLDVALQYGSNRFESSSMARRVRSAVKSNSCRWGWIRSRRARPGIGRALPKRIATSSIWGVRPDRSGAAGAARWGSSAG